MYLNVNWKEQELPKQVDQRDETQDLCSILSNLDKITIVSQPGTP